MIDLITARTEADALAIREVRQIPYADMTAAQKQIYDTGIGAYRHTDLNRVGQACAELYTAITDAGYTVTGYTPLRTDWARGERPTPEDMEVYLATVNSIKQALNAPQSLPASMRHISYTDANNIEKLLKEVDDILTRLSAIFLRSGTQYSGTQIYIAEAIT